jgi:hypothetical protein
LKANEERVNARKNAKEVEEEAPKLKMEQNFFR